MPDIQQLISDCQAGDAQAWECLVRDFQSRVFATAVYYLKDREEATDATQEVFIKVYNRLDGFRNEADAFLPWLLSITRNSCIDRLRKQKLDNRLESDLQVNTEVASTVSHGPEQFIEDEQQRALIYAALDEFNQLNREVVLLKDIQGLKISEVAEILDMSEGTVKSRSNRARIKLGKIIARLLNPAQVDSLG